MMLEYIGVPKLIMIISFSNQKGTKSVRYKTQMLKDEDVKKISESKTNEIVRARKIVDTKKQSRVDTERYRDARNEENRIHLAKNKQSTMAHMELIQKYNTIHRSREMYRNVSDTRRAFITRTNSRRSKTDETIKHFRELRNERGDQADTDNVFDELEDMGSYEDIAFL
ncbi:hypothetical protein CWI39_1268p0010 [Hamiltosporidium magnivora]|uniref:Uncharacterized protein n=1 Tax=Hamiltosporidium magnivora TaxID=148818 RepID=A0A4V2JUY5_9MICR|nr:hypothetical protein CWI39_1268p0010 [Hamiltosporidium magnivora]